MSASGWVYIDVDEIVAESANAFLCRIGDEKLWLPKSQVSDAEDYQAGDEGVTLAVTEFIARAKGLGE